jgi:hypothetical protein
VAKFEDGELFERSFDTASGRIDVLTEIIVVGSSIELRDIAVYPNGAVNLRIEPAELVSHARSIFAELTREGFDEVRITGTRVSGARQGRRVNLVIQLRKGGL